MNQSALYSPISCLLCTWGAFPGELYPCSALRVIAPWQVAGLGPGSSPSWASHEQLRIVCCYIKNNSGQTSTWCDYSFSLSCFFYSWNLKKRNWLQTTRKQSNAPGFLIHTVNVAFNLRSSFWWIFNYALNFPATPRLGTDKTSAAAGVFFDSLWFVSLS